MACLKQGITLFVCIACQLMFPGRLYTGSFNPFADKPTGKEIKRFGAGIISDGLANRDMAISPDGNELFYTIQLKTQVSIIAHSKKNGNNWSEPEVAWFSGIHNDLEPAFSPDGSRLYFSSKRPLVYGQAKNDFDIWYLEKSSSGWSDPIHMPAPLNTGADEYYPSVTRKGDIYFTRDTGENKEDILIARRNGHRYETAERLSAAINSAGYEFNAWVDPDETFILFTGYNRKDGIGNGDLYISLKGPDGKWLPAKNPVFINSSYLDYCPFVSADKKYLFFSSNRSGLAQPFTEKTNLKALKTELFSAGNGNDDIYWVELSAVMSSVR